MRWLEITINTQQVSTEAISAKLLDLGIGGVSIEERWDWERAKKDGLGDLFPAENGLPGSAAIVRGYFPVSFLDSDKQAGLQEFLAALPQFGLAPGLLSWREVDDVDWENAWKDYWHPTPVGEKLLIVPAWYESYDAGDRLSLLLDPGAAFGTGTHETTQLCLEWLEKVVHEKVNVLDLGCGSGILALAASLLGAGIVQGVDYDEIAVRSSQENAAINSLDVAFTQANLFLEDAWDKLIQADVICANLTADIVLGILDYLPRVMSPGCHLIISGIINIRRDEVLEALLASGYQLLEERHAGEWVALWLERKK